MNDVREGSEVIENLNKAVLHGDVITAENVLKDSTLPSNIRFDQGDTLLHLAVRSASPKMVSLVLNYAKGIDFTSQNRRANTPLCLAVQLSKPNTQLYSPEEREKLKKSFEEICLLLIDKDPNVNETVKIQNIMRKSTWDFLNKTVKNPKIYKALNEKIIQILAREAKVSIVSKDTGESKALHAESLKKSKVGISR